MAITLKDGRQITLDLYAVRQREYIEFYTGKLTQEGDAEFLSRVTGLPVDEIVALSLGDWRRIIQGLRSAVSAPVENDPK